MPDSFIFHLDFFSSPWLFRSLRNNWVQPLDCFVSGRSILLAGRAQWPRVVAIRRLKTGARIHFSWPSLIAITVASLVVACIDQDVCSRLRALAFDSSLFSFFATFVLRRVVVVAAAAVALPSRADSEKPPLARPVVQVPKKEFFFSLSG